MKHTLSVLIFIFFCTKAISQSKPFILGETDDFYSKVLAEKRQLNIYLPSGYNPKDTVKYPVVYLLDGGADEDFIHITGIYQFNSFEWIKRVPSSIIVGIVNVDRKRDMTYATADTAVVNHYPTAGHSDKFIQFIQQELQPYVEKKFKTTASRTLIGESLGGLLATEILLKHPSMFTSYIIVSPSLWWDDGSLLKLPPGNLLNGITQLTHVYIGVGKEGLTPGDKPHVMEVDANLLAEKIKNEKNNHVKLYFDYLPEENHATILHQAVMNALKLFQSK